MKTLGRNKCVAVYIMTENGENFTCEFHENGYITMNGEFNELLSVSQINQLFQTHINPIIQEAKSFLEQNGYKFNLFESIYDKNIEIKQMTYETQVQIKKAFDIQKYQNCISTIFIDETNPFKQKNTYLRFKRVSNFSKFNSQEAFILEKANQGLRGNEIIQLLVDNYPDDLNETQAAELVAKIANELEVERGVRKSDIKIKENPGFKTEISVDKETSILRVRVVNMNNIYYLNTLPIYIDSIIRLTQNKKDTNYPTNKINEYCSQKIMELTSQDDITPDVEEIIDNAENAVIEGDETITYQVVPEKKNAFDLFFDDEEDEDDVSFQNSDEDNDVEMRGGDDSSSEESITSDEESFASESEDSLSSLPVMADDIHDEKEDNSIEIDYKILDKPLENEESDQEQETDKKTHEKYDEELVKSEDSLSSFSDMVDD